MIRGDSYTPLDKELIAIGMLVAKSVCDAVYEFVVGPTLPLSAGTVEPVAGTALDFRTPMTIGQRIEEVGGYDFNYNLIDVKETHPSDTTLKHCAT